MTEHVGNAAWLKYLYLVGVWSTCMYVHDGCLLTCCCLFACCLSVYLFLFVCLLFVHLPVVYLYTYCLSVGLLFVFLPIVCLLACCCPFTCCLFVYLSSFYLLLVIMNVVYPELVCISPISNPTYFVIVSDPCNYIDHSTCCRW